MLLKVLVPQCSYLFIKYNLRVCCTAYTFSFLSCFGLKSKTGIILEVKTKRISGSGLNIKGAKCENGKGLSQTGYICKRLRVFTGVPHTQSAGLKTSTPLHASLVPALPSRTLLV